MSAGGGQCFTIRVGNGGTTVPEAVVLGATLAKTTLTDLINSQALSPLPTLTLEQAVIFWLGLKTDLTIRKQTSLMLAMSK